MFFNFSLARAASVRVATLVIRHAEIEIYHFVYLTGRASGTSEACLASVMLLCLLVVPDGIWILRPELCIFTHDACQSSSASVTDLRAVDEIGYHMFGSGCAGGTFETSFAAPACMRIAQSPHVVVIFTLYLFLFAHDAL